MASEPTSREKATKQRIITHMNADHTDSLSLYLEHHYSLLPSLARTARLEDITFSALTLSYGPQNARTARIPISPPMTAWSQARERVVEMHEQALQALNRSDITVTTYKGPRIWWHVGLFVTCLVTFCAFAARGNFVPGGAFYNVLLKGVPGFARFCYRVQPLVLYGMIVVHGSEAGHMARSRLQRHGVRRFSGLWWKWVLTTFVEGFTNFIRFDECVEEVRREREAAKKEAKARMVGKG